MRLVLVIAGIAALAVGSLWQFLRVPSQAGTWRSTHYEEFRTNGLQALRRGDYRQAIRGYTAGIEGARRAGDALSEGQLLANLGAAYQFLSENRLAIQTLLAARQAADKAGDTATMQAVEANLANLYIQAGDTEAAAEAAMRGAALRPQKHEAVVRITILMSFARAISKARGVDAADTPFREAYTAAAAVSAAQEAEVLDLWGNEAMEADRLEFAEDLLTRAWWKRRQSNDARLPLTEGKLGRLYRKKGEFAVARVWMDRLQQALASGRKIPVPEWSLFAEQGHVYAGEGRLEEALTSYREAMTWARKWRQAMPPAERLRLGAERRMVELFDGHLRTAARLYRRRPSARLSGEMFTAIQTTRAWSMEKSSEGGAGTDHLYEKARRLEGQWLGGSAAAAVELKTVRAEILERESAAPAGSLSAEGRLEAPAADEAVLTYWLDDEGSWLWLWTEKQLRLTPLPGRQRVVADAEEFRKAVAENAGDMRAKGERLLTTLLGDLRQECLRAHRWDVVADAGLFQVPFAALPVEGGYLMERTEVRLVPNALRFGGQPAPARRFLAIADPVFNAADERAAKNAFWPSAVHASHFALELPRLPGTRRESEAALAAWAKPGFATAMHLGVASSEEAVLERLSEWRPGVVHVATHTVTPPGEPNRPRLALSLRADGSPGLLAAEDIATLRLQTELVVLSACHSAGDESARGSGLLGLTRAWLTAGSRQVVATLWPVGDESTKFFSEFHERLAEGELTSPYPAAAALRQAQLKSLRGGGRTAEPRFWAGHVLLARR